MNLGGILVNLDTTGILGFYWFFGLHLFSGFFRFSGFYEFFGFTGFPDFTGYLYFTGFLGFTKGFTRLSGIVFFLCSYKLGNCLKRNDKMKCITP